MSTFTKIMQNKFVKLHRILNFVALITTCSLFPIIYYVKKSNNYIVLIVLMTPVSVILYLSMRSVLKIEYSNDRLEQYVLFFGTLLRIIIPIIFFIEYK